jgi:predicted MPP superfamily phosphohydrolase
LLVTLSTFLHDWYFLIFMICCLGHALIWVRALNWMHGIKSQEAWTDAVRLGLHVILSGLPFLWFCFVGFSAPAPFWWDWPLPLNYLFAAYLWLIGILGLVLFPIVWVTYLLRREPASSTVVNRDVHNVGRALGRRPIGTGRRGWQAKLPLNQAYEIELVERDLVLNKLPAALEGLRILHLSDTHFCGRPGRAYFERVFHYCNQKPFDLLVVTGDLIDGPDHYHWLKLFEMLKPGTPRWAISGNHDSRYELERVRNSMRELGFQVFSGISVKAELRGVPVIVAGNEAPWNEPIPDMTPFENDENFRLALIHSPDQFAWAVKHQFNLVLAGHNHGGQIRIPAFGSIFVPSKTGRRYDMGVFQQGNTILHVNRGLSGGHPVRYFCRPEATWLTLRCQ